jgi:radical SAM-linked protein
MKFIQAVLFSKTGSMRYISHLDLMRLFSRALRRTGFKFYLTKGFNPRPVVRIKNALKLGIEATDQQVEFELEELVDKKIFISRLNHELPKGIQVQTSGQTIG